MTVLAQRTSARCNGVAKLHGETSRQMWQRLYDAKSPRRVPIGHVTNGVHTLTWLAEEALPIYRRYLHIDRDRATPVSRLGSRADRIPPAKLWQLRCSLRARLIGFIRRRLAEQVRLAGGSAEEVARAHTIFDENTLTIGFARRFATYKRAPLVFRDAARLEAILKRRERPMQLIFAGKAHPRDLQGQSFARTIYRHAHSKRFRDHIVLIEDYDMNVGHMLTAGCDVWLNNPLRPNEASGTSGMKPPLHGGLNCSILDGWWPEAFNRRNGWAIGDARPAKSGRAQDRYDVEQIYALLEDEIGPAFYRRGRDGLPGKWVRMMVESIKLCDEFNSHRMLGEYNADYYLPAHRRDDQVTRPAPR
jgi:starch phosphorylase